MKEDEIDQMDQKNLDIYGDAPIPWSRARDELEDVATNDTHKTFWLATVRPDGRPHVAGVGALWDDGSSTSPAALEPARAGTWPRTPTAQSR